MTSPIQSRIYRVATVLEIREVRENEKRLKWSGKSQGIGSDRLSKSKNFTTLQIELDSSFCQNAVSRDLEKFSEVRNKSGKRQGN